MLYQTELQPRLKLSFAALEVGLVGFEPTTPRLEICSSTGIHRSCTHEGNENRRDSFLSYSLLPNHRDLNPGPLACASALTM